MNGPGVLPAGAVRSAQHWIERLLALSCYIDSPRQGCLGHWQLVLQRHCRPDRYRSTTGVRNSLISRRRLRSTISSNHR